MDVSKKNDASISEHLPVFRAPREGDGRSAPVHGRVALCTSPLTQKKLHGEGTYIHAYGRTLRLLDRIGPVGQFGEKKKKQKYRYLSPQRMPNYAELQHYGIC